MSNVSAELRIGAALFVASTAMPVIASTAFSQKPPLVAGVIDVILAFCYFIACARLAVRHRLHVTDADRLLAWRFSQYVFGAIPVLLVVFLLLPQPIKWEVLIVGLAWRAWLLLYTLPFVGVAVRLRDGA